MIRKIGELIKLIDSRIKNNNISVHYNAITSKYRFIIDTNLGIFKIDILECDVNSKTVGQLMDYFVDEFATVLTEQLFNI